MKSFIEQAREFRRDVSKIDDERDQGLTTPENILRYDDIDYGVDESILEVSKLIMYFNKLDKDIPIEDRQPIKLLLYSYGGDGQACFSLLDIIALSKTPVWTINMGVAMSAGLLILLAGHKRFALKGSTVMIHRGSCFIGGEQSVVESTQKYIKAMEQKYQDFLLSHTKIDPKVYKKKASADMYFDENDALKNGIVDYVVEDFDMLY